MIPVEQIVEKTEERDFGFFLDHGNFFKVVDTLEKFEVNMVNKESQAGRDFVLFKRQLYQMYEVRHRSIYEHEQFSLSVERRNLKWLAEANRDFIHEIHRINYLDQLADTSRLNGQVFKKKMFNDAKVKGLGAFGLAAFGYMNMTAFSLMMGPLIPSAAIVGSLMFGMNSFAEDFQDLVESFLDDPQAATDHLILGFDLEMRRRARGVTSRHARRMSWAPVNR